MSRRASLAKLTQHQIFERYKCKAEWNAHNELILASTFFHDDNHQFLVTGGNDDTVAIWDLTGLLNKPLITLRPDNGTAK